MKARAKHEPRRPVRAADAAVIRCPTFGALHLFSVPKIRRRTPLSIAANIVQTEADVVEFESVRENALAFGADE